MFVEIRKIGKNRKYYLVHSYRVGDRIKRISRYLGSNLSEKELEKLRKRAEQLIKSQTRENSLFEFELSKKQIEKMRCFDKQIKINHLQNVDWTRFTEDFTYNTNAIEGSTVTIGEVKKLVEKKDIPENNDELETIGVSNAVSYIKTTKKKLDLELIKKLHFLCFEKTKSFAGDLRTVEVVIRNKYGQIVHQGASSEQLKTLLNKLCNWYEKHKNRYPPLILAALIHNEFENIHPFRDGNGRVGRLLLNYVKKGKIEPTLRFLISQYKKKYK